MLGGVAYLRKGSEEVKIIFHVSNTFSSKPQRQELVSMSIQQHFKHGIGRLTAAAEGSQTRLTQISHKSPMRWVPLLKSSVDIAGAAVCALSNYGGGMLQGDTVEVHVHVKSNARLGITTQGASRIYTQRVPKLCQATLDAKVDTNALLVWAPDPCSLFQKASFQQIQNFRIDPTSSVALIDWFSSGRYRNGEHWVFDQLSTRTCLTFDGEELPFLQDAVHMDLNALQAEDDPLGVFNFHAFASLILYGDEIKAVLQECQTLSDALLSPHTRIRERFSEGPAIDIDSLGLSGRVCMGSSRVTTDHGDAHVVRFAATTNEDLYRIFQHCLHPLHSRFGLEFYKDRIRAQASEIPRMDNQVSGSVEKHARILTRNEPVSFAAPLTVEEAPSPPMESETMWVAYMLADSALPTGSFAHSAGIEVAAQIGILSDAKQLETFIQAAVRSSVQITAPFLVEGHKLSTSMNESSWKRLDRQCQAVLAPNALACAASVDQGKSLARVAEQWLDMSDAANQLLIGCFGHGSHVGPVLGALGARLGLSVEQVGHLYGYCVARDMVSSAVRLSLVGPLASIKSLQKVQHAANDGWKSYRKQSLLNENGGPLVTSAGSSPIIEAIHPCHEALQVRLFRT